MARKCRVHYDKDYDRLMLASKSDSEVIAGSVRILNLILDFNTENKVVNVELLNASDYLQTLGINSAILPKVKEAELSLKSLRNGYIIIFALKIGKKTIPIPYNVHFPKTNEIKINSV